MRVSRIVSWPMALLVWALGASWAEAQFLPCVAFNMVVPDGTPASNSIGWPIAWWWFEIKPDRSYSFVVQSGFGFAAPNPPTKVIVHPPLIGSCAEGGPIPATNTSHAEPATMVASNALGTERLSFKSKWATNAFVSTERVTGSDDRIVVRGDEATRVEAAVSSVRRVGPSHDCEDPAMRAHGVD